VCRRLTGNETDALDATQEALIAITRGIGRFDGRARFATWAYRVATNACLDELRRRRRRPVAGLPDEDTTDESWRGGGPSLDDTIADRVVLDRALAALPLEFRSAIVLRDVCQLDYAEIAEVLDIPPGTVRSRIARGRAALARSLDPTAGGRATEPVSGNPAAPDDRPTQ
jgi:RNA polymerase sigma-70 factor (ECF subfamily)